MDTLFKEAEGCHALMDFSTVVIIVIICCVLGLLWAAFNVFLVNKIDVAKGDNGESDSLVGDIPEEQKMLLIELGEKISNVNILISRVLLNFSNKST